MEDEDGRFYIEAPQEVVIESDNSVSINGLELKFVTSVFSQKYTENMSLVDITFFARSFSDKTTKQSPVLEDNEEVLQKIRKLLFEVDIKNKNASDVLCGAAAMTLGLANRVERENERKAERWNQF